jgi:hypothetical protein
MFTIMTPLTFSLHFISLHLLPKVGLLVSAHKRTGWACIPIHTRKYANIHTVYSNTPSFTVGTNNFNKGNTFSLQKLLNDKLY